MILNKGLTGILRPSGEFTICQYGLIMRLIKDVPNIEQDNVIVLSSIGNGVHGTVYQYSLNIGGQMTKEQYEWIMDNFGLLSINQKKMVTDWLELLRQKSR